MVHRDVLVVDDDAATRILLERLLSRIGLTVQTAVDGEDAARALETTQVDAIIMDLFMPKMNGTDLLKRMTREHAELLHRVIVLSAAPEPLLRQMREQYPIWCAMRKPADISELMQNVLDCVVLASPARLQAQAQI
jgi:CheY-like chemotaxis protein